MRRSWRRKIRKNFDFVHELGYSDVNKKEYPFPYGRRSSHIYSNGKKYLVLSYDYREDWILMSIREILPDEDALDISLHHTVDTMSIMEEKHDDPKAFWSYIYLKFGAENIIKKQAELLKNNLHLLA